MSDLFHDIVRAVRRVESGGEAAAVEKVRALLGGKPADVPAAVEPTEEKADEKPKARKEKSSRTREESGGFDRSE